MAGALTSFLLVTQVGPVTDCLKRQYPVLPVPSQTVLTVFFSRRSGTARTKARIKRQFVLRSRAFYLLLLLVCGKDIELNAAPIEKQIAQLLEGQNAIMENLTSIEEKQNKLTLNVTDLKARFLSLEHKVAKIDGMSTALTAMQVHQRQDDEALATINTKIDAFENGERRNNLIFYGFTDVVAAETASKSEELVANLCSSKLELADVSIAGAHRIGAYREGVPRPVNVNFSSFKAPQSVLSRAHQIKGTDYSISEDISRFVFANRKKLWEFARERKQ